MEPNWAIPHKMSDTRDYLNDLPGPQADRLYAFLRGRAAVVERVNCEVPSNIAALTPIDPSWPTGLVWLDHITCEEPTEGPFERSAGGYPRFQLKFSGKRDAAGVFVSPEKSGALAPKLRDSVFGDGTPNSGHNIPLWMRFKGLARPAFKAFFHHIAYIAKRADDPSLPGLPADLGQGSAIAHQCDNKLCCKKAHVFSTSQLLNMDMQRCIGAILVVLQGVILKVEQCPHYRVDHAGNVLQASCARLKVIELPNTYGESFSTVPAFVSARATYEESVKDLEEED